eukprot:scaffold30654_cov85-Cyclotella_meneghiniana.AAC.2
MATLSVDLAVLDTSRNSNVRNSQLPRKTNPSVPNSFHSFGQLCGGLNNQSGVAMQQSSIQFCREAFEAVEERLVAFRDPSNAKKSVRSEGQPEGERE